MEMYLLPPHPRDNILSKSPTKQDSSMILILQKGSERQRKEYDCPKILPGFLL